MRLRVAREFPRIVNVFVRDGDDAAERVADSWRAEGYRVRIVNRSVRALGAIIETRVVVLVGRK